MKTNGELFTFQEIKSTCNLYDNVFNYNRVRLGVDKFLKKILKSWNLYFLRPSLPLHLKTLVTTKQGCKGFYKIFIRKSGANSIPYSVKKWEELLRDNNINTVWNHIYKACFETTTDTAIIWLQYKVLYIILGTRNLLNRMKIKDSNLLVFSGSNFQKQLSTFFVNV